LGDSEEGFLNDIFGVGLREPGHDRCAINHGAIPVHELLPTPLVSPVFESLGEAWA
jgi:hypothetical protein